MKIPLTLAMVGICFFSNAQKAARIDADKIKEMNDLQTRMNLLYACRAEFNDLFSLTGKWILLPTDNRSKEELRNVIFFTHPKLLEDVSNLSLQVPFDRDFLADITRLTEEVEHIMSSLQTFDSYEDQENLNRQIKIYLTSIASLFSSINNRFEDLFSSTFVHFSDVRKTLSNISEKNKMDVDPMFDRELLTAVSRRSDVQEIKQLAWKLETYTMGWLYIENDSLMKRALNSTLASAPDIRHQLFKSVSDVHYEVIEKINVELDSVVRFANTIRNTFTLHSVYEDPLVTLLAQEEFESYFISHCSLLNHFIEQLISAYRQDLSLLLLSPTEQENRKKTKDIIKMLKNDDNILMIIENQKNELIKVHGSGVATRLNAVKIDNLVNQLILMYRKLLTHEEVKEIIRFQESTAGKKMKNFGPRLYYDATLLIRSQLRELVEE